MRARSCSVHYHSHGILVPPILMQLQSNMRDDKYRRVGCWGHRLQVLAQPFYADNTLHTLLPTSSSERTCGLHSVEVEQCHTEDTFGGALSSS